MHFQTDRYQSTRSPLLVLNGGHAHTLKPRPATIPRPQPSQPSKPPPPQPITRKSALALLIEKGAHRERARASKRSPRWLERRDRVRGKAHARAGAVEVLHRREAVL